MFVRNQVFQLGRFLSLVRRYMAFPNIPLLGPCFIVAITPVHRQLSEETHSACQMQVVKSRVSLQSPYEQSEQFNKLVNDEVVLTDKHSNKKLTLPSCAVLNIAPSYYRTWLNAWTVQAFVRIAGRAEYVWSALLWKKNLLPLFTWPVCIFFALFRCFSVFWW